MNDLREIAPEDAVFLDGLDKCCIGHTETALIYSYTLIVEHFIDMWGKEGGLGGEDDLHMEVIEYVEFNIINYKVGGEGQFIIMYDF